jgi:LCP family protein required for cell wall assembly
MQTPSAAEGPRHSAFAAAFLSFIFPGLGQAYLGRWRRALAWAAIPLLLIALGAGLMLNHDTRQQLVNQLADPQTLLGVIGVVAVDLLYRLASVLDAYRLARAPDGAPDSAFRSIGSAAGLAAILLVLVVSHVAVARPVYLTYDTLANVFCGDCSSDPGQGALPSGSLTPEQLSLLPQRITAPPAASVAPGATATPTPVATPTPEPLPSPSEAPPWTGGTDLLNILLIGVDSGRAGETTFNTDTMIVVSIDPVTKKTAFISLPRDTAYIPLPKSWPAANAYGNFYPSKINTLFEAARLSPNLFPGPASKVGYTALMGTLGNLYGLDIPYYVQVNLGGFRDVIDQLGGIVIDVQNPVYDSQYPADDGRGNLKLYIPPGIQYMNGPQALAYARARHATSDFDRAARQQRVVTSLREQVDLSSLLAPGVIDTLLKTVKASVHTNIPASLLPQLVGLAQQVDLNKRVSLVLTPPEYSRTCYLAPPPCPQNSLYQLVANPQAIKKAVQNAFKESPAQQARDAAINAEGAVVTVLNGTTDVNTKTIRIADYLAQQGIDASVPPVNNGQADRTDYADTVITFYNGAEQDMPATVKLLQDALKVTIVTADDPAQTANAVVIIGDSAPPLRPSQ